MAHAKTHYYTSERNIVAAARAYCAENDALEQLCELYEDLPDHLAIALFERMEAAKQQALKHPATTMIGVIAKARMVAAGGLFDVDPLIISTIEDLLAVYPTPRIRRWTRTRASVTLTPCGNFAVQQTGVA
jgi:hypothetical protein